MVTNNSYAPPKSTVADVSPDAGEFEKASRGVRLGAALLDGLIFTVAFIPSYGVGLRHVLSQGNTTPALGKSPFAIWIAMASTGGWFYLAMLINLVLLIVTGVLVQRNGQTIAKKWLGIKVVRTDGSKATLGRIFWLRNVVNGIITVIPVLGSLYALVDILFIFGEAKRCCHDYVADTIVVRA